MSDTAAFWFLVALGAFFVGALIVGLVWISDREKD